MIPIQERLKSHHFTHTLTVWMSSAEVVELNSLYGRRKEKQTFLKMPFIQPALYFYLKARRTVT